jgi:hypothetical protein
MRRLLPTLVVAAICALAGSLLLARPQHTSTRWEYARLSPAFFPTEMGLFTGAGYQACVAEAERWTCRDFRPPWASESADPSVSGSDTALRKAFASLGSEGWELVSVVVEPNTVASSYLFKRQRR